MDSQVGELKRFPPKWLPVRRKKTRQINNQERDPDSEKSDRALGAVGEAGDAHPLGAMIAAEILAARLQPVADDADAARGAMRRQSFDRALEAVIGVRLAVHDHLEGLVVVVAAGFASGHGAPPRF